MLSPRGVFRCFLKGHSLRTDWREVCSLSEGQETVTQWTQSFDDLIKPRAKSVEHYSNVLGFVNQLGSHLSFGTNTLLRLKVQSPLTTHSECVNAHHRQRHVYISYSTQSVSSGIRNIFWYFCFIQLFGKSRCRALRVFPEVLLSVLNIFSLSA